MANSEQPQSVFQERLGFHEERRTFASESVATTGHRVGFWSRFLHHEWSSAALCLFLDVASWIAIYRIMGWFRHDAFYATPFQFFIINVIQLGVIVAALYFVGGYDRTVEKLTLGYAAEQLLAITAAATVIAAYSSLGKRAPSIRNYWNASCTRSSGKRESTPWNPFTKHTGVICRWALSIRSGRSKQGFNWHALRRIITSSGFSISSPRQRRSSFARRSSSLFLCSSGRRTALRSCSARNVSVATGSDSFF